MDLSEQTRRLQEMQKELESRSLATGENIRDYTHELSVVDNHPGDIASEDYQRNFDASMAENDQLLLEKVRQALERIAAGEYFCCSDCGEPIEEERLLALPYVSCCRRCFEQPQGDPGFSKSFPPEGEFTWPKFGEYGTASGKGEEPRPGL